MRADRLLSIMLTLQANGKITTYQLAEKFEVSRRTILRDIDALSFAGIPIYTESGHGGGVYLDENYRVSLTGLNEAEVRAIFVSTQTDILQDVGLGRAIEDTMLKLFASLPSLHRHEAQQMQQRILLDSAPWWSQGDSLTYLDMLKKAVFEDYCVQVCYKRADGTTTQRRLEPYSLVAKASVWYLVAQRDNELRTYRVSRFSNVEITDKPFERDVTFDLTTYWRDHTKAFLDNMPTYSFTVSVKTHRMRLLKLYAEGSYTIRETSTDDTSANIDITLSSLEEAKMLVLGLGTDVEIIQPIELHEAVVEQAHHLLTHHTTIK